MKERIQKLLSAAGICSRRQAEVYLQEGRVTVNGSPAALGDRADFDTDLLALDGRPVEPPRGEKLYILLNKPRGYVTTLSDEKGRPTVAELVKGCGCRVYPVGRLDMDSDGLLLLTDDGAFAQSMSHPSREIEKEYHVTVSGQLQNCVSRLGAVRALEDGSPIVPARVESLGRRGDRELLSVTIHQGKNRQVRRMCALVGLKVHRLQRVREGGLCLGSLPPGKWRKLSPEELRTLVDG